MTTHEPPLELLARQLDSIREQTHRNWVCVISDDCSSPERFAAIEAAVADEPRFVLSRSAGRLGFYRNFERALSLAPAGAEYVALADQDDAWHPDKLATLLAEIGDARLIYSDARVIDRDGRVIAETYWGRRSNNHSSLLSLLVANSVTGAASLFPAALLEDALPFPPAQFAHFHDHWLALVALSLGDIAFVDRPLYDYVQHGDAALGHAAANRMPAMRERLRRGPPRPARAGADVADALLRRRLPAAAVRRGAAPALRGADPGGQAPGARPLRARRPLAAAARRARRARPRGSCSAAAARRWARSGCSSTPSRGAGCCRPAPATARPGGCGSTRSRRRCSTRGRAPARRPSRRRAGSATRSRRCASRCATTRPRRVNLLIPSIDLQHFFGGYIGKFNLARRLAARGVRVRIVTVDPVGELPLSWREDVEAYSGLRGLLGEIEIEFGRESQGLEVSRADAFVATTWWTAHIAHAALRSVEADRFLYLIQEYEPFTFPMGSHAALAGESYRFPHAALFSTELLRDYFRRHGLGVYAGGAAAGDAVSASFDNAITAIDPPDAAALAGRRPRRLLFYARPEPHAARNMFELGVLALGRALERGAFADGWSLHGIGTVRSGRRLDLGGGASMDLLPRSPQAAYGQLLREHDVGLALMFTPHPSLVPMEMASAGMLTVTNTFENKTAEALAAISPNLIAAEPGIEAVAAALCEAADGRRRRRAPAARQRRPLAP